MTRSPAVRVSAAFDMLDLLDTYEPGSRSRVWERIPAPSRVVMESLSRLEWIPLEHDLFLPRAIVSEFGRERSRDLFRRSLPSHVEKPLLRPFVSGMLHVLGDRRVRLLKVIPKAWGLVFRDFCTPRVGRAADDETELIFDDIPPAVRPETAYFDMWEGVCLGLLDLVCPAGELDYKIADDSSQVVAHFKW